MIRASIATRLGASSFVALALGGCATAPRMQGDSQVGVSVGQILKGIRCEFVDYVRSNTGRDRFLAVKPWEIQGKLNVSVITNANDSLGGTVKAYAGSVPFSLGFDSGVESKDTSSLTVDFKLDPGKKLPERCDPRTTRPGFGLAKWLEAVESAKIGSDGLSLKDKALTFGLTFGVYWTAGVNGSFGVQPVTISASALRKRDDVQTLTIAIQPAPQRQVIYVQNVGGEARKTGSSLLTGQSITTAPIGIRVRPDLEPLLMQKQRELLGD